MKLDLVMVFDVESIGLHGEGFAVGYVVIDLANAGQVVTSGRFNCDPDAAVGEASDRQWVYGHMPFLCHPTFTAGRPREVRAQFWKEWRYWREKGAVLMADVPYPVETNFVTRCLLDAGPLGKSPAIAESPYPLLDVASVRAAAGLDPLATEERLPEELPVHDPLCDARQSARLLVEAIRRVSGTEVAQLAPLE